MIRHLFEKQYGARHLRPSNLFRSKAKLEVRLRALRRYNEVKQDGFERPQSGMLKRVLLQHASE